MPSPEPLLLQELDFISMQEAARKFDVSIETLRGLIEKGLLTAYVSAEEIPEFKARKRFPISFDPPPHDYAKVTKIHWNIGELRYCHAELMDKTEKSIGPTLYLDKQGLSYEWIMIKPPELRALGNSPIIEEQFSTKNQATPEEHAKRRKSEGAEMNTIAAELAGQFFEDDGKPLQYGRISEILQPGKYNENQNDARRQYGRRLVLAGGYTNKR